MTASADFLTSARRARPFARSPLQRLLLVTVALLLAWQAQATLLGDRPTDGWLLYLAAALVMLVAAPQSTLVRAAGGTLGEFVRPGTIRHTHAFWFAVGSSLVLSIAGLMAFLNPAYNPLGWTLHAASIVALVAAFFPRHIPSLRPLFTREVALLALIMAAALYVRVWQSNLLPEGVDSDEARVGLIAREVAEDTSFRPMYVLLLNRPLHIAYLSAVSFTFFGENIAALRLISALFGTLTVPAAFLLANRWFGRETRAGLMAAALVAGMRWDLTFSRIALDGVSTPFFILWILFFLDRGLERKQLSDFALAGLILGIGFAFYQPMQIFAALLVAIVVVLCTAAIWRDRTLRKRVLLLAPYALCFALGLFIAAAPIGEAALREPAVFFSRNQTASIFYEPVETDIRMALWNNTVKYLGMFNYQGDAGGQHNLPGAPMLDTLSGMLLILGAGLALWRVRELPNLVMVLLFAGLLQAGIWSADYEAPHSLRTIGVIPSLIFAMTLALVVVTTVVRQFADTLRPRYKLAVGRGLTLAVVLLLAGIAWNNVDTYFSKQAHNPIVWHSHSIEETWIAREMNRLGDAYDFIVTWRYWQAPSIAFLAPHITNQRRWTVDDHLPLSSTDGRPVAMYLDSTLFKMLDEVRRNYPDATYRNLTPPGGGDPVIIEVLLFGR